MRLWPFILLALLGCTGTERPAPQERYIVRAPWGKLEEVVLEAKTPSGDYAKVWVPGALDSFWIKSSDLLEKR